MAASAIGPKLAGKVAVVTASTDGCVFLLSPHTHTWGVGIAQCTQMNMLQAKGSKNITGHNGFELGDAYLAIACQSAKSNRVISLHTKHASVTKVLSAQILSKQ